MATTELNQASPSSAAPGTIRVVAAAGGEAVQEFDGDAALAGLAELVGDPARRSGWT